MFEDEEEDLPVTEEFAPGDEASAEPAPEEAPWNEVAKRRQAAGGGMWSQAASGLGSLADKVGGFLAPPADAATEDATDSVEDPGAIASDDNPLTRGANAILKAVNSALMYGRQISGIGEQRETLSTGAEPGPDTPPARTAQRQNSIEGAVAPYLDTARDAVQGGVKKIMGYLQGEGAASSQQVKMWEQKADPTGTVGESMKKALAVALAESTGGPAAGYSMLQAYRLLYDHQRAIAAAAAGRGDTERAAEAFNAAMANVPDGNTIKIQPGQAGGYTAAVTPANGGPRVLNLTRENFDAFVRGPQGQFDAVLAANGDAPAYLQGGAGRMSRAIGGDFRPEPGDEYVPSTRPGVAMEGHPTKMHEAPRISPFMTPIKTLTPSVPARGAGGPDPFTPEERAAAREVFPMSSESAQQKQYMAQQRKERLGQENQRTIAQGKNDTTLETTRMRTDAVRDRTRALEDRTERQEATKLIVAEGRTGAYDRRSVLNSEAVLAKVASNEQIAGWRSANSQLATTMRALSSKIANGVPMTPQETQAWARGIEQVFSTGGQQQAPARGQPQQAPAQGQRPPAQQQAPQQRAPAQGSPPPGAAYRKDGKWYDKSLREISP